MIRVFLALLVVACSRPPAAGASEARPLVVGSVRDADGRAIPGASVRATDAHGTFAGQDRTDDLGTFAIHPLRAFTMLEVRCSHCRTERIRAETGGNLSIVVRRYTALESDVPNAGDLAALPYGRIVDALALVPFLVPSADGSAISDRALGGAHGLVVDNGAPLSDLATGRSALIDFPDRSVQRIDITRADEAFRYGPYAASGLFALDTVGDAASASLDAGGQASGVAFAPLPSTLRPAFSVSSDAGVLARRYDADLATPLWGGRLRANITNGTERIAGDDASIARDLDSASFAYATASRTYRTFFDFSTSRVSVAGNGLAASDYRSAYTDGSFRLERPGVVTLAAGFRGTQLSSGYASAPALPYDLAGRSDALTTYLEAHFDDGATRLSAALGYSVVSSQATLENAPVAATERALLPSLELQRQLAHGFYARAGYSQAQRQPTLLESAEAPGIVTSAPLERTELLDSALGFDAGGRVKLEAIAYREFTRDGADRRLDGLGGSFVWQVSPLISVRAWSLRTDPRNVVSEPYAATEAVSRQVLWATYDRRDALRIDALLHRDIGIDTRAVVALDADVLIPFPARLALDVTTYRRDGSRRYGAGLRLR